MADNSLIPQERPSGQGLWNLLTAYGTSLVLLILAIPMGIQSGVPYAVALIVLAIASFVAAKQVQEQKAAAEREKDLQYEQLLQSQKLASIGELSAGIAHEINNPLAIIRQEAEWLLYLCKQEAPPDMAEVNNCLTEIVQQVDRGRGITENLLNYARKRQPVVQAVELNRLIDDMVRLVAKEASHNNIEVVKELCPELPLINSDAPLLRQVILNLLNNAVQAIGKDGIVTVITKAANDGQVLVHINDNGCGIAKENLAQVFDPFFTTKPQGKGTGLGLSICHGIIERLGGKIVVSSELGKGSSFTIKLPQALQGKRI